MGELVETGTEASSRNDVEIASGGDVEKALWTALYLYLTGNHVHYFTERVQECDGIPRQATLFDVTDTISVSSLRPAE